MAYKALYRTYRPSTFDEVAGQQHIVKTIKNALTTGKIAHAYLFTGPRGTGKTTMAKLLAKSLNCEEGLGCQCNECKNCKAIMDGTHPDVLELDAASNNGVDNIRELIDNVKYGTILGKYKIYIIDEVHMLSAGAFNALLKTLEEPPENVIFILATTEPHKVLPTILSRCQRYDFSKVGDEDIRDRIQYILAKEDIDYNESAINLIIKLADGGMRDALSILDQVLAYSGNTLNENDILNIFALESKEEKIGLLKSIISKNVNDVLNRLNNYISKGSDLKRLTDDLMLILKDILIFKTSRNTNFLSVLTDAEVREIGAQLEEKNIVSMIESLMNASKDYKGVTSIAPVFEITLLKLISNAGENKTVSLPEPETKVEPKIEPKQIQKPAEEKVQVASAPVVPEPEPVVEKPKADEPKKEVVIEKPISKPASKTSNGPKLSQTILEIEDSRQGDHYYFNEKDVTKIIIICKKDVKNAIVSRWSEIKTYTAHPTLSKYASLLIDGRPLVANEKILVLEYEMTSLANRVNLIENQLGLQNVCETIFGRRMIVYAMSRSESVDAQSNYRYLYQAGKLPKKEEVSFNFLGE